MTRTAPARRTLVVLLAVAALVVAAVRLTVDATDRTTAAWTADVPVTTDVALGTWTASVGACTAVRAATLEPVPGRGCDVVDVWGYKVEDGHPVGSRWAQIRIDIDSPGGYEPGLAFLVEVDLSAPGEAPADWRYEGGWFFGSNLLPLPGARCADLPTARMLFPEWAANAGVFIEIDLREAGASGNQSSCERQAGG